MNHAMHDRIHDDTAAALDEIFPLLSRAGPEEAESSRFGGGYEEDGGVATRDTGSSGESSMPPPTSKGAGSRKKGQANDGPGKVKRTRSTQSCDACRARKTKCDRPPPGTSKSVGCPTADVCTHCSQLSLACTFDYKPRKRGPPNMYIMKVKTDRDSSEVPSGSYATFASPSASTSGFFAKSPDPPSYMRRDSFHHEPQSSGSYTHPPAEGYYPPSLPGGTLSGQNSYGASALGMPGSVKSSLPGKSITAVWDEALHRAVAASASSASHRSAYEEGLGFASDKASPLYGPQLSPVVPTTALTPASNSMGPPQLHLSPSFSSPRYLIHPSNINNPLDQVLPRGLLLLIIDLFFDYIYPLIPAIHRPTFMRDLAEHREEREGEECWTHMVFSLVAATLIQVPRAFVPLPRREVKALVDRCWELTRTFFSKDWTHASLERLTISYLNIITSSIMGKSYVHHALAGANAGSILRLRLHQEETYASMPPLEREFRRRLFWLAYDSDRSICAIDGLTPLFTEDECDADLPSELDDEYITETAYLDQPEDTVSLITGFNYISKIFRVLGQVMIRRRHDKRTPPTGIMLQMRLTEVSDLYEQIMAIMEDCPEPLKLDLDSDNRSIAGFSDDWDAHASADIRSLFFDPKASRAVAKDAFLVQQANIYVTQQMVRYITLQFRDELLQLRQTELGKTNTAREPGIGSRRKSSSTMRRDWSRAMFSEQEKDEVVSDLLAILQKIPIQVIAVNSAPLVSKVRFVASTLLDALTSPLPIAAHHSPEATRAETRTQKAQSYLWDFLRILSEIEALYSFEDDDDAKRSGAGGDAAL